VNFPSIVLIDNFNGCNLSCSICDHKNMKRPLAKMPWKYYCKVIDEIAEKNRHARVWLIFFGDPFLCDDMPGRIAYAKMKGLKDVVLNTNGLMMAKEKSKAFIDAGLDWIYVGIDAATKETYDKIRIGGDFHKVIDNVLTWQKMRHNIFVQFVECELNQHEKEQFIEDWSLHGIKVKVRPMVSWIGLVDNKSGIAPENHDPCYWFKNSISILNNGDVALCACDIHGRFVQGDIRTRTMQEVWKEYHQKQPEPCKSCGDWQFARSQYV